MKKVFIFILMFMLSVSVVNAGDLSAPVSYYSFDTNANDDYSSNNGVANGDTTHITTGQLLGGGAYDFGGSSGYIDLSSIIPIDFATSSISLWVKADNNYGTRLESIFSAWISNNDRFHLQPYNNGNCYFYQTDGSVLWSDYTMSCNAYTNGAYNHIVATSDGSVTKLYIDNTLVSDLNLNRDLLNLINTRFYLGASADTTAGLNYFDGQMDEVAIYDFELTTGQISTLYNGGVGYNPLVSPPSGTPQIIITDISLVNNSYFNSNQLLQLNITNTSTNGNINSSIEALISNIMRDVDGKEYPPVVIGGAANTICFELGFGLSSSIASTSTLAALGEKMATYSGSAWAVITEVGGGLSKYTSVTCKNNAFGVNTLQPNITLNFDTGANGIYDLNLTSFNNKTSNSTYITVINDITNPITNIITNQTEFNTFQVNMSEIFNYSDTNLDSCEIYLTELENVTINDSDTFSCDTLYNFSTAGLHNLRINVSDLAGNYNDTTEYNITINPYVYINFFALNGTAITNYSYTIFHPDLREVSETNTNNPVILSPVNEGSLDLGLHTIQFSKDGYKTSNVTININESSGAESYNFTIVFARIIINLYNDDTKAIIPTESFSLQLSGPAGYVFTSNGTLFNISDYVIAGTYTGLISSTNYESKEIFFTYTSQEVKEVDVYFIPLNLTNIGFVTIEAYKADNTPNKYILTYAKQWFASEGIYKKVQETKTGGDGTAELKIILEDYIYQFCIYTIQNGETCTDDVIIKTTENGKVIPITEERRITTQPSYSELLDFTENIRVETSNTTGFRNLYLDFSWVDLSGFNLEMCYTIHKDFQYTKELVDSNCVTGATGTFEQIYFLNSSYAYIVKVNAEIDGIVLPMYSNTFQSGKDSETISGVLESKGMQGLALVLYIVIVMTIIALLKDPFKGVVVLFIAIIGINVFFNQLLSPYALSALMSFSGLTAWGLRQIR